MSSLTCRNCKAENPVGSKFCNNCGAQLPPSTNLLCPNCQASNPRHLIYCDNCGSRLLPEKGLPFEDEPTDQDESTPSKPRAFSLPMREPGDTGELDLNQLPEWLRTGGDLASLNEVEEPEVPVSDDEPEGFRVSEILGDWLSEDLADESIAQDTSDQDESSVWLSDSQPQAGEQLEPADDETTDWWQDLGGKVEERSGDAADEAPPSWLSELDAGDEGSPGSEPPPDWLSELAAEQPLELPLVEPELPNESSASGDLADWLEELEPVEQDVEPEPVRPGETDLTDLPQGQFEVSPSVEVGETLDQDEADSLPDWLRSDAEAVDRSTESPATDNIPDWLLEGADDEQSGTLSEWRREEMAELEQRPEAQAPGDVRSGWLDAEPADSEDDILPDWLLELGEQKAPTLPGEFSEESGGIESDDPEFRQSPGQQQEQWSGQTEEISGAAESTMPEWLRDEVGDQDESEEEMPDWLAGTDEGSDLTESEMPEWLRDEVRDTAGLEDEDLPDWLGEIGHQEMAADAKTDGEEGPLEEMTLSQSPVEATPTEAEEIVETAQDELAELLRELAPRGTGVLTPLEEEVEDDALAAEMDELGADSTALAGEVPAWLAELSEEVEPTIFAQEVEFEEKGAEPEDGIPAEDEPDLIDLEPELPESLGGTGELAADEVPEWLAALAMPDDWPQLADEEIIAEIVSDEKGEDFLPETVTPGPEQPSPELSGVPKELARPGLPEWMGDEPSEPTSEDEFSDDIAPLAVDEPPDWLQELSASEAQTEPVPDGDKQLIDAKETGAEWQALLDGLPPPEQEGATAKQPLAELTEAEIPPWLQALRPREFEVEIEEPSVNEPVETEGPLAGLPGIIQVGQVIAEPRLAHEPRHHMVTKEHRQQVALLTQITRAERPATQFSGAQAGPMSIIARAAISIGLFAVVILGLLLPAAGVELPVTSGLSLPGAAQNVFDQINSAAGKTVLLSFEYSPAMAGELDPIAVMLLVQLAENGSPVVTMSQYAAGVALAERAIKQVEDLNSQTLGFVPGEAVGLRLLGGCLAPATGCETMFGEAFSPELQAGLADVRLAIVLTGERDSLVNWIEQVGAQSEIPLITGVTQALGPVTMPYLAAGQLQGAVEGTTAAAAYERTLLDAEGVASELQTGLTIVQWAVILLLAGGTAFYGFRALAAGTVKRTGE
jgi:hypothetical protein